MRMNPKQKKTKKNETNFQIAIYRNRNLKEYKTAMVK